MPLIRSHKRRVFQVTEYNKNNTPQVSFFQEEERKNKYVDAINAKGIPNSEIPMDVNKYGFMQTDSFQYLNARDPITGTQIVFEKVPIKAKLGGLSYKVSVDYSGLKSYYMSGALKKEDFLQLKLDPSKTTITEEFKNYASAQKYFFNVQKGISKVTNTKLRK